MEYFKPITHTQTEFLADMLKNNPDKLPFLPDKNGLCNTKAIVSGRTGAPYTGANLLLAKSYLAEKGVADNRIVTFHQATQHKSFIKKGEKGFPLSFWDSNTKKPTIRRFFSVEQTQHPEKFNQAPEQKKGITIEAKSATPKAYFADYFKAVESGASLKVSPAIAKEFKENLAQELQKDPKRIFEIAREAQKSISHTKKKEQSHEKEKNHEGFSR